MSKVQEFLKEATKDAFWVDVGSHANPFEVCRIDAYGKHALPELSQGYIYVSRSGENYDWEEKREAELVWLGLERLLSRHHVPLGDIELGFFSGLLAGKWRQDG
jgi:hypothetical protein